MERKRKGISAQTEIRDNRNENGRKRKTFRNRIFGVIMLTLGIDTTAKTASVALQDGGLICEFSVNNTLTHSENLIYMIDSALTCCGKTAKDVERVALCIGPGSFTGVRIGAAAVKGLCFGKNIPIAPVSTLEALAHNPDCFEGLIATAMDARRDQTYFALFLRENGEIKRLMPDSALSVNEACEKICEFCKKLQKKSVIFVGDGAKLCYNGFTQIKDRPCDGILAEEKSRYQSAASVLSAAQRYFDCGNTVTDSLLECSYLRKPQADIK